jgi:hypothetical protein
VNWHRDIVAECEIVEQGDQVEECDLDEVWCERYPASSKTRNGNAEGSMGELDEFGETIEGDKEKLTEGNEASGLGILGRDTF